MQHSDTRLEYRLKSYKKTLTHLEKFIIKGERLNELEETGIVKAFEYSYDIAWKCLKDFYEQQGESEIQGSRDAIQLAFNRGMIADGQLWMEMLKDRNRTAHTYNEETAKEIAEAVLHKYYQAFLDLAEEFDKYAEKQQD